MNMKTIRQAVLANRGGLSGASDAQIKVIWDSLDETTRQQYLASIKTERTKNADSITSKRELRSGS